MTTNEVYNVLATERDVMQATIDSGNPAQRARERVKNLLLDNIDMILDALKGVKSDGVSSEELDELREANEAMEAALAQSGAEIRALKEQLRKSQEADETEA